ncbi:MAG: TraB/GumN family protein [Leptonema sp. (in: Bacteria)]|nr:TraB/GumN family protein [Leptonema sp. (in: bacteria)]
MSISKKSSKKPVKKSTKKSVTLKRTASSKGLPVKGPYRLLKIGSDTVLILGTAHISKASVDDVERSIQEWKPDVVCIELCRPRYEALLDPDRWKKMDLTKVIREKKLALLASNLILASFQKKIGEQAGVRPGEEMRRAAELAAEHKIDLALIDREIRTTLSRAWGKVGFFSKLWLGSYLLSSLLIKEEVSVEDVEAMKNQDVLEDLFSNIPKKYETVKSVILDERDSYLAESTRQLSNNTLPADLLIHYSNTTNQKSKKGRRILSVIGAGHLPGMARVLSQNEPVNVEELNTIPKPNRLKNILLWMGASVLLFLVALYSHLGGTEALKDALLAWVVARSLGSGIGAILSGANLLTILVTVVMAPIVPLIPGSRLWMFSALTEVWRNKPQVADFESIADDTETLKGLFRSFYTNLVLHMFWITSLVSLGLTIGNLEILRRLLSGIFTNLGIM